MDSEVPSGLSPIEHFTFVHPGESMNDVARENAKVALFREWDARLRHIEAMLEVLTQEEKK